MVLAPWLMPMLSTATHTYRSSPRRLLAEGARIILPAGMSAAQDGLWRDAPGPTFPYRSVEVLLSEGSFFRLSTESIARVASEMLFTSTRCCAKAHLHGQIVPAVRECPELLLEMAARLPWSAIRPLARQARWRTHPLTLSARASENARMVLSTCSA